MKKFTRTMLGLIFIVILAGFLSFGISRHDSVAVNKGYSFGPPNNQSVTNTSGTLKTTYFGFPATYRIAQSFTPAGDLTFEQSYDQLKFDMIYVITNFIFWTALFVAVLAPITILYRPKRLVTGHVPQASAQTDIPNEVKSTEVNSDSAVK